MAISPQQIQQAIAQIRTKYQGQGQGAQAAAYQEMNTLAQQYGVDAQQIAGAMGMDVSRVQGLMNQYQAAPQYGLQGTENAVNQGVNTAVNTINQGAQQAQGNITSNFNAGLAGMSQRTDQGIGMLNPYAQQGGQAFNYQAALSGALGADQQAQAYQNYQSSPGQQYLQQQGEKSLLRNASAIGGLGGGAVRNELQRHAIGMAAQDFDNSFNRLGQMSQMGLGASSQQAGMAQGAGMAELQGRGALGNALAGINMDAATNTAGLQMGGADSLGQYRFQTGRDMANAVSGTSSALANLMNQQGGGMADIIGSNTSNLAQLLSGYYEGDAQSMQGLGQYLSNLGMNAGNMYAGQPLVPGAGSNYLGQFGQVLGGMGGLAYGLNLGKPTGGTA